MINSNVKWNFISSNMIRSATNFNILERIESTKASNVF